jgi:hypothetical protein
VGLRAVLDAVVNRKIPSPRRESNPRSEHNFWRTELALDGVPVPLEQFLEQLSTYPLKSISVSCFLTSPHDPLWHKKYIKQSLSDFSCRRAKANEI